VFDFDHSDYTLRNLTVEAFYYLLQNGYISPVPSGSLFTNLPHIGGELVVTERGRTWFSGKAPVPEHREGYMAHMRVEIAALDPVIDQYVAEGLIAFGNRAYFAAAVMFGAAAEKAVYLLAASMQGAFKDPARRTKMQKALERRSIQLLEKQINDDLLPLRKSHYTMFEGSEVHLMSFFEAIRVQRNDAVHPENASVSNAPRRALGNCIAGVARGRRTTLANAKSAASRESPTRGCCSMICGGPQREVCGSQACLRVWP
jgi:hypothetical protein